MYWGPSHPPILSARAKSQQRSLVQSSAFEVVSSEAKILIMPLGAKFHKIPGIAITQKESRANALPLPNQKAALPERRRRA